MIKLISSGIKILLGISELVLSIISIFLGYKGYSWFWCLLFSVLAVPLYYYVSLQLQSWTFRRNGLISVFLSQLIGMSIGYGIGLIFR